jgi:hypothetical protein
LVESTIALLAPSPAGRTQSGHGVEIEGHLRGMFAYLEAISAVRFKNSA